MELGLSNTVLAGDPRLIDHIVGEVKSQGIFDQFRKECIADVDTKPAYQNLRTRVEGSVNSFLSKQTWKPDLNKNQLRETLRKQIHDAPYLDAGVERIVDQVVNPKVYSVFMPQIEDVVYKFLGIERPKAKEKNGCGLKDLLPKDLDPVSPESDKNSLKDESLESLDINDTSDLNGKQDDKADEQKQDEESYRDKNKVDSENGHIEEKTSDEVYKMNKTGSNSNLNTSSKSDDKVDEEEEEVSPTFEPIDIMNLNESNISNDSHLSGISELTSHRSRSPDFSNELSRDNFEYSNQDSQLSKVSSDSRLSIVTDFGSSNHDLTPVHDSSRDETTKDKYETKSNKDNFKAIRELDSSKNKTIKNSFDFAKSKDDCKDTKDFKSTKSVSSKENSRDATDSSIKDKYEHRNKEKSRDSESIKSSKSTKEKSVKDAKYYKEKSNEKKKSSSEKCDKHSSEKYDKHSKSKPKVEQTKESFDKTKDISENIKDNANKLKDEKLKEPDKKDNVNKEVKDLKDIYKEKIRELREKKELTEKEKLNKDKDIKLMKEVKDKKDPLKDKKSNKKEHKSSSSSSSKNPSTGYHESKSNKTSEKIVDGKDKRSESKDKAKRDEKRLSKENKSYYSSKSDLSDKSDKSDSKKISRSEKEDKSGKADVKKDVKTSGEKTTNGKKDVKSHLQQSKSSDRAEKSDGRKESKTDSPSKDKKRREDKKSKTKDDHSSLRKNSNDRRSTDRDGSNGSNNKTSPSNSSNSNVTSNKSSTSNLTKENHVSNSGSETSDSIEETQVSDSKLSHQSNCKLSHKVEPRLPTNDKNQKMEIDNSNEAYDKQEGKEEEEKNTDSHDTNLPLKKRLLSNKDDESISGDVKLKKPKFAKNIHEAKKLMKIRKQMEKQKLKEDKKVEKKVAQEDQMSQSNTKSIDNLESMPDHERVQIIEIPDEEYEEPYPEKHESRLMLDERSIIMPGTESCSNEFLKELNVTQSSSEAVSSVLLLRGVQVTEDSKTDKKHDVPSNISSTEDTEDLQAANKKHKDNSEEGSKNEIFKHLTDTERYYLQAKESILPKLNEIASEKSESLNHNENKIVEQSIEGNMKLRDNQTETQDDNEETKNDRSKIRNDDKESSDEKQIKIHVSYKTDIIDSNSEYTGTKSSSSVISEDNEDCRYFKTDNEKSERFSNFLESLELVENSSLEDIIESLGGKVVSSMPKSMAAPPLPKLPKRSSSPLSDILVNNSDNNNDGHKRKLSSSPNEDAVHNVKKRKFTKKSRFSNLCNPQGISNGENFVMPLSPDSDVSATSDKTASSTVIKEEKSRNRTSHQRYSSDDLYKPRPLFSSSSRRSRRSNQA